MTGPGKSASRPLLSIGDTIESRVSVNIQLELFKAEYYRAINVDDEHPINKPILPSKILFLMKNDHTNYFKEEHEFTRLDYLSSSAFNKKKAKIKKYVGEFY